MSHPSSDPWQQPPRTEKGWSGLLIGCLIVGGVLLVLCCGAGGYMFYSMQPTVVQQPAEVRQMADEIAELEVPEGLQPAHGFKMKMFFVMSMKGVVYEAKPDAKQGMMVMMEIDAHIQGVDQNQMRQAMSQQVGQADKNISIKKSVTREFTIRGETCQFTFSEAVNTETDEAVRVVNGTFPSHASGVVMLWMVVPAEKYDEAEIEKMIKSIK
jgi:hypothetical protein